MEVDVQISGLEQVLANLTRLHSKAPREAAGALYEMAEEVIATAKPMTPFDLGTLRASGFVGKPSRLGMEVSVPLGFGGQAGRGNQGETNKEDVEYAEEVHEATGRHFQEPGTGAKYLERAMMIMQRKARGTFALKIRARLGL